jgi:ABC-2 type transport system ATP-binding protein
VLSFDQRGFGESGGHAYVENPAVEGHDVRRLVRLVSRLGWVKQDGRGDPRMGAIGRELRRRVPVPDRLRGAPHQGQARCWTRSPPRSPGSTSTRSLAPDGGGASGVGQRARRGLPRVRRAAPEGVRRARRGLGHGVLARRIGPRHGEHSPRSSRRTARGGTCPRAASSTSRSCSGQGTTDSLFPLRPGAGQLAATRSPGRPGGQHLRRLQRWPRAPRRGPAGIDVTSDPASEEARGRFVRAALAPLLRRAAPAPRHGPDALRQAPPRHA